jgi:phage-related baseplate assembly protein
MSHTQQEKDTLKKALKFTAELVTKLGTLSKKQREVCWRQLSESQKQAVVLTFIK